MFHGSISSPPLVSYFSAAFVILPLVFTQDRAKPGSVWPMPASWNKTDHVATLAANDFHVEYTKLNCTFLDQLVSRYQKLIWFEHNGNTSPTLPILNKLEITVADKTCPYPHQNMDESYDLFIPAGGTARLTSKTIWGALRGYETFSQLLYVNENLTYLINETRISDKPRFEYRGIYLNTAKSFISVKTIKKLMDAMEYNKMNVFHWQLSDNEVFRFDSKIYPNLTQFGSKRKYYSYTTEQMKDISSYAMLRGIRVVPEIKGPGLAKGLGKAFPHLLTPCHGVNSSNKEFDNLNPILEETYDVYGNILKELGGIFQNDYVHLGLDGINFTCWGSSPDIRNFMNSNGYQTMNAVLQHYLRNVMQRLPTLHYIIWASVVDDVNFHVNPDKIVLEANKNFDQVSYAAQRGQKVLDARCWQLGDLPQPFSIGDWKTFYFCDPRGTGFRGEDIEKQRELVLGGEALLSSGKIDSMNVLPLIWPRASAIAERLWTPLNMTNYQLAKDRLLRHRCLLIRRGIPVAPMLTSNCEYDYSDL